MSDFYSYILEVENNSIQTYSFETAKGSLYYVYFDPGLYDSFLDTYPHLLASGYGFGFHRAKRSDTIWEKDTRVSNTITQIVSDLIDEKGEKVVLLYHCDFDDGKQKGRQKIFDNWYKAHTRNTDIYIHKVQVDQIGTDRQKTSYYMGFITAASNPYLEKIIAEFDSLSQNLVTKT